MSKQKHAVGWAPTPAQLKEFWAQVETGRITKERFQKFLRGEESLILENQVRSWEEFYLAFFGIKFTSPVEFPKKKVPGFDRLIIVAKGLTLNKVFDVCSMNFPTWKNLDNLDNAVSHNDREPKEAYAIWVRNRVEADEELKSVSANQFKGITLLERMLYELKYFSETGGHLDLRSFTLCSGSRYCDGDVPDVSYNGSEFRVSWHDSNYRYAGLGPRAVIS